MEYNSNKILDSILKVIENKDKLDLDLELKKFLIGFSKIPRDNQIIVINSLIDSYNLQEQKRIKQENEEKCFKEGHVYGDWHESIGNRYDWHYNYWYKVCERCGYTYYTYDKPKELIKLEEEKKLESKLQKKLKKLGNGDK